MTAYGRPISVRRAFARRAFVLRALALAALSAPLAGCFALAPIAMSTAGFYTMSATGKMPADHFVSWATGEDCSAVHVEAQQPYCIDKNGKNLGAAVQKQCYATLGTPQCYYAAEDPYGTRPDPIQ